MTKRHLKTISSPKSWPVERKTKYWITRTNPGPHNFNNSMPIGVIFTDILKYNKTKRELKKILNQGLVLINGKIRKDIKFPVGLMDVIEFPDEEYYRVLYKKDKFYLKKISKEEKGILFFKVADKKIVKKGKMQLNLSNGENILVDIKKDVKTGDTILFENKKIKDVLKFEKGSFIYLTGGKYIGEFRKFEKFEDDKVIFSKEKEKYETLKKYALVIGKNNPTIDVE